MRKRRKEVSNGTEQANRLRMSPGNGRFVYGGGAEDERVC